MGEGITGLGNGNRPVSNRCMKLIRENTIRKFSTSDCQARLNRMIIAGASDASIAMMLRMSCIVPVFTIMAT